MTEKKLQVVVAGLGRIAWLFHLPQLLKNPHFELLAVADPMAERRQEATAEFKVPRTYADCGEMLDREKADLLVLCSPTCFHREQALLAFERGMDVFCEKPLASDLAGAEEMVAAMRRCRRRMMVYQPHRVRPETVTLKQIVESGMLGKVFMAKRNCAGFSRRNDWQAKASLGGGMLNNYGAHFIDQFMYVFGGGAADGAFRVAGCEMRRMVSLGDADDVVKILLTGPGGVIGDIDINMAAAAGGQEWIVYGDHGTATMNPAKRGWNIRYIRTDEMPPLALQEGLAASGRKYASEGELPWRDEFLDYFQVSDALYYDYVYDHFALGKASFAPIEGTLELMRLNAECRRLAAADPFGC